MSIAADCRPPADPAVPHPESRSLAGQLGRFLFTGGGSVAIDLALYFVLLPSLGSLAAKGLSYAAGVVFGFVGNKFWTFRSSRAAAAEVPSYVGVYAVTLAINLAINAAAIAVLGLAGMPSRPAVVLAFFAATGVTTVANFLALKFITFRPAAYALD